MKRLLIAFLVSLLLISSLQAGVLSPTFLQIPGVTHKPMVVEWNPRYRLFDVAVIGSDGYGLWLTTISKEGVVAEWVLMPVDAGSVTLAWNPYDEQMYIFVVTQGGAMYQGKIDHELPPHCYYFWPEGVGSKK